MNRKVISASFSPFSDLGMEYGTRAAKSRKKKIVQDLVYLAKRVSKLAFELQKYVVLEGVDADNLENEISEMNESVSSIEKLV